MEDADDRPSYGPDSSRPDAASDDADDVIRVFADMNLGGVAQGVEVREDGEDEKRHARRSATLRRIFGG